jgi:hypothetical protein
MRRIRFVHWNRDEAEERAVRLRALGYDVDATPLPMPFRRFAEGFDAVVIDLSRLPSQGRDVGLSVRIAKPTRGVPLVFVGGAPEKVARVRETLPDATFTSWDGVGDALRRARPVPDAVVPSSALAGYSATPLPRSSGSRRGPSSRSSARPKGSSRCSGPRQKCATATGASAT